MKKPKLIMTVMKKIFARIKGQEQDFFNQGIAKFGQDDLGAVEYFNKALEIDPESAIAYFFRGNSYYFLNNYTESIVDFTQAMKLNPNYNTFALYKRGLAKSHLRDYLGAITDLTENLEKNIENAELFYHKGLAELNLNKLTDSVFDFTKAIEIEPNNKEFYLQRGAAKNNLQDYSGAILDYTEVIKLDPTNANGY